MNTEATLVIFSKKLPHRPARWWKQFSAVLAPAELAADVKGRGPSFEALEDYVDSGNVEEAAAFVGELARMTFSDGTRVSKSVVYKGYELWWIHYDELYHRLCLPYTQYRRLLKHLTSRPRVAFINPPAPGLFRAFLKAHGSQCEVLDGPETVVPPFGIWLQVLISLISLPWLLVKRPQILLYTGDLFDPPRDHSFRMRFIYEELRARNLSFVECIRSLEPARVVLAHAFIRRRPVIYSYAIKVVLSWAASFFGEETFSIPLGDSERAFKLDLAVTFLHRKRGVIWSITALNWIVRLIGIRSAIIPAAGGRTFQELIACKLAGIPSVGILHGAPARQYVVYDFMPEYDGEKHLGLDVYGMWSKWWRDYYLKNGKVYGPEHLPISGPMRPAQTVASPTRKPSMPLKVLFIAEQLSAPEEVLPYLEALMDAPNLSLLYKFRAYRDGFEDWLKTHRPDILRHMNPEQVLRGSIGEAVALVDVVVGSHSTAVLEALLELKPPVFFNTKKWGDSFGLESLNESYGIFAKNPEELLRFVLESPKVPREVLMKMQEMFFGDPYQNGSAWVVQEAKKRTRAD